MAQGFVAVIGGVNVDITAATRGLFVVGDSIPGEVALACGGVARNIAHNLHLLGHTVRFVSMFGSDVFGKICHNDCQELGLDLTLSERHDNARNGLYLCVNDNSGEMVVAVADMDIVKNITPDFLSERMGDINQAAAIVADSNLETESLQYLLENARTPLFIDTVSTAKAARVVTALKSGNHVLHTLKLNRLEALISTESDTVEQAARWFVDHGVQHVFITLGAQGVLCADAHRQTTLPAEPTQVVNATGAGDAFLSAVVHAHLLGEPTERQAAWGLRAAHLALLSQAAVNPEISTLTQ